MKNSETKIVTKLWENKTNFKKLKLLQNTKTKIVTKLKKTRILTILKKFKWDRIQLKVWQISKTQTVTKFNNSNCDKTQQLKLWQNSKTQILIKRTFFDKSLLLRTTWHFDNRWDVFEQPFMILRCFCCSNHQKFDETACRFFVSY